MKKTAFIFPGQGAQYVGMGKELVEQCPEAAQVFDEASTALGYDMRELCFTGPAEELEKTENTQPAILSVSVAALRVLQNRGCTPVMAAGLSLGEYAALVAADSLVFAEAAPLVRARGRYMQEAVPLGQGKMAAIIGLNREQVLDICRDSREAGLVEPANYNAPGQIVVAGETRGIEYAVELAQKAGAKRAIILPVSAPFHCSMLAPAGVRLAEELKNVTVQDPTIPVIANVSGDYVQTGEDIRAALIRQVSHSVYWEDTIERMVQDGVEAFIEVGPGKVLSGFVKRIAKDIDIYNVEDMASLHKLLDYWGEVC
jgi:[acyl-carrier-protein] S-malonyltransferase